MSYYHHNYYLDYNSLGNITKEMIIKARFIIGWGVRIATILTQSGIPGQNPRVPYGCYLVRSL